MLNVPNYQGMFLRGHGSQRFIQNNGSQIGKTETNYLSEQLGEIQGDTIRNHKGILGGRNGVSSYLYNGVGIGYINGDQHSGGWSHTGNNMIVYYDFSRVFPTSNEVRPINIAVKYLIKAE